MNRDSSGSRNGSTGGYSSGDEQGTEDCLPPSDEEDADLAAAAQTQLQDVLDKEARLPTTPDSDSPLDPKRLLKPRKEKDKPDKIQQIIKEPSYSLAASRLYAAISSQSRLSRKEALGVLFHEVQASAHDRHLSADELLSKLSTSEVDLSAVRAEGEEDEEEAAFEDEEEGLASVARLLSQGQGGLDSFLDSTLVASNLEALVEYALKKLREQWRTLLHGMFPVQHLQTMLLVCVVQLITVERLLRVLPIAASYAAFAAMVYTTLRMFHSRRRLRQYKVWRRLLTVFNPVDEGESAKDDTKESTPPEHGAIPAEAPETQKPEPSDEESQYSFENMEPYAGFFVATVIFILAFGLCGKYVPNCLLLCGVSLFFCLFCFVGLTDELDWMAVVAFVLNVTAHLPMIQKKLHLGRWALFQELGAPRLLGVKLSLSLGSAAFVAIPLLYAAACLGRSRKDAVRLLVPQLVCFVWSDTALTLFMAGFVRVELGSVLLTAATISLFLFPTGAGGVLVLAVLLGQVQGTLGLVSGLKALSILGVLFLPLAYKKLKKSLSGRLPSPVPEKPLVMVALYVCAVLAAVSLLYHGSALGPGVQRELTNLSWPQFEATCGLAPKGDDNQVANQILCSQLKGMAVRWKGSIQSVRVAKIDNSLESLLDYLPMALAEWLRCFYGGSAASVGEAWGGLDTQSCSLSAHHWLTFEVEVSGPFGDRLISSNKGSVILTASHVFHPLLAKLKEGDVVKFLAYFDVYPVTKWTPKLRLLHIACSTCKFVSDAKGKAGAENGEFTPTQLSDLSLSSGFWSRLCYAFKFLFNFAFSPALYIST